MDAPIGNAKNLMRDVRKCAAEAIFRLHYENPSAAIALAELAQAEQAHAGVVQFDVCIRDLTSVEHSVDLLAITAQEECVAATMRLEEAHALESEARLFASAMLINLAHAKPDESGALSELVDAHRVRLDVRARDVLSSSTRLDLVAVTAVNTPEQQERVVASVLFTTHDGTPC